MAGSDQYGNIVAGIELIRRVLGPDGRGCFGVTAPLLTHSDGRKIGKSEGSALWLTRERTSPYAFYQYWINVADGEVGNFLNWFTHFSKEEILEILETHDEAPRKRYAQRSLAQHMTDLLYGAEERRQLELASEVLFGGGDPRAISENILAQVVMDLPHTEHPSGLLSSGLPLLELLPETSVASSKREAREFLKNGAIWINGEKALVADSVAISDLLPGRVLLIRRGKKYWHASTFNEG
jgi:tyrosyl-tRNA synthetase